MKRIVATLTALLVSTAWAASEDTNTMLERLKSPASVCVVGDPCAESIGKASVVAAFWTSFGALRYLKGIRFIMWPAPGVIFRVLLVHPKLVMRVRGLLDLIREWTPSLSMSWRAITQCQHVDCARTVLIGIGAFSSKGCRRCCVHGGRALVN